MTINAHDKFVGTVMSRLEDYNLESNRNIEGYNELKKILKTATGSGYTIDIVETVFKLRSVSAKEYIYDNGLIYLDSEIEYRDKTSNNLHVIRQLTLTTDYKKTPLVNIVVQKEKKAIQQLLVDSASKDEIFPDAMRNIEIQETSIHVGGHCGSVFETYTNSNDGTLMLEKYKQFYPVSNYEDSEKDILRLCGCGSRSLEIIYSQSEPIFAQLSDKYTVEMAGLEPNSSIDVKYIVGRINTEVSEICNAINDQFDKLEKRAKKLIRK